MVIAKTRTVDYEGLIDFWEEDMTEEEKALVIKEFKLVDYDNNPLLTDVDGIAVTDAFGSNISDFEVIEFVLKSRKGLYSLEFKSKYDDDYFVIMEIL